MLSNISQQDCHKLQNRLNRFGSTKGLEVHAFKVGWYNETVGTKFVLPYDSHCVAFVVISKPCMFEKCFLPFLQELWKQAQVDAAEREGISDVVSESEVKVTSGDDAQKLEKKSTTSSIEIIKLVEQSNINGEMRGGINEPCAIEKKSPQECFFDKIKRDPLDMCMQAVFKELSSVVAEYSSDVFHDFDMTPFRRPKILVQTAGHVAGAVTMFRREDLNSYQTQCTCNNILNSKDDVLLYNTNKPYSNEIEEENNEIVLPKIQNNSNGCENMSSKLTTDSLEDTKAFLSQCQADTVNGTTSKGSISLSQCQKNLVNGTTSRSSSHLSSQCQKDPGNDPTSRSSRSFSQCPKDPVNGLTSKSSVPLPQTQEHVVTNSVCSGKENIDPWPTNKKFYPVCLHPDFGGWFALRGALVLKGVTCEELQRKPRRPILDTREQVIELLERYNYNWQDYSFRDVIATKEQYSEQQRQYFTTLPKHRTDLLLELVRQHA